MAFWPEPGGFLPFADSTDGDYLGRFTDGPPEAWRLAVEPRHEASVAQLPHGLVTILLEWTRGSISYPGLPALDPRDDPLDFARFRPMRCER